MMLGYHLRKNYIVSSVAFLILVFPLVLKAHLIDPNNFNADDLKKIDDAVTADKTDGKSYNKKSYNCYHFARDLQYNLWKNHKIESQLVNVKHKTDGEDDEHNAVKVTIRDKDGKPTDVYIEPQDDQKYTDVENLLQGLDETKTEKFESIKTTETGVFFPVVTTYVGNKNTHGSLPVKGGKQKFTVKVKVIDAQQRPVAGQNVTITVTNPDGTTSTKTGVTDENGEVSGDVEASVTGNDIIGRKTVDVKATIHVLPQENEGTDSKDPTTTKKLRLLLDRRGACAPFEPDGRSPDRPIYLSEDGQVAMAEFSFFNNTSSPIEFQPALDCRRNCDASNVIDVAFIPDTLTIAPYGCTVGQAFISNLTAPAGDTIIGQLHGTARGPDLVFMSVYDSTVGAPCTPTNTMLDFLGISDVAPPARLLDTSDCTWASDGSSCEDPDPSQDICALDTLMVELNTDTIAQLLGGESPAELIVQASPEHAPPPGRYHLLIAHCKSNILDSPFTHHQYAFPCDSDGLAFNNYTSAPPWTKDFFIGTDFWPELIGYPDGWHAQVRDPRQDFAIVSSNTFFAIAGREVLVFIPEGELTSSATFRATAFGHMGSYLFDLWSGRVHPAIGEGPLFPVATNPIVVTPPNEASTPSPVNFAMGVPEDGTILSWTPGFGAISQDVYFGNTFPPPLVAGTTANSFNTITLEPDTTYFWQIDGILSNGTKQSSPVWTFSTGSPVTGTILREVWEGISGTSVSDLLSDPAYPDNPTFSNEIQSFETPTNFADNFGSRVRGWLHPETTGDYTFWVASDDNSELWLSSDESPSNAALIGEVPGWTSVGQWDKYPEQKSSPITLSGGHAYYIEALMKAGTGDDNLSAAWAGPGIGTDPVIIDGSFLSPWNFPEPPPTSESIEIADFSFELPVTSPVDEGFAAGAILQVDDVPGGELDFLVVWKKPPETENNPGTMGRQNVAAISEGVALVVENDMLILTVSSNSLGQAIVSWDGIDGSATNVQATNGLGDFDITDEGTQHGIALEIASNEKAVDVSVVLFSDPDNSSEMTKTIPATTAPIIVDYLFEDFLLNGDGATLTDIEAIVLFIGSGGGVTGPEIIEIDSVYTYSN